MKEESKKENEIVREGLDQPPLYSDFVSINVNFSGFKISFGSRSAMGSDTIAPETRMQVRPFVNGTDRQRPLLRNFIMFHVMTPSDMPFSARHLRFDQRIRPDHT